MKKQDIFVAVCVPSNGVWRAETGKSIALMFADAGSNAEKYNVRSLRTAILGGQSSMLCQNREAMTKEALKSGATHIMQIDTDMIFPKTAMRQLLAADKPFIAANCTTRVEPIQSTAHDLDGLRLSSIGKAGLQKVQHVGLAVSLVKREVFERLRPPLYLMDWIPSVQAYCGEDVYFCQKVREAGFDLWVDHDLSREVYHIGDRPYTHADIPVEVGVKLARARVA